MAVLHPGAEEGGVTVLNVSMVRTPQDLLTVALRELRIATSARITFERFPALRVASASLAWHISGRMMVPMPAPILSELSMINLSLTNAFNWLAHAATLPGATVRDAQTHYLAGLMYHAPEIKHVEVCGRDGEEWDPFHDGPLSEWLPENPGATFGLRLPTEAEMRMSDADVRHALLLRMLPPGALVQWDVDAALILNPAETMIPPRMQDGEQ